MIDYELLDSGAGRRLERFGSVVLDRPDPEVLWQKSLAESDWKKADARFNRNWVRIGKIPNEWQIAVDELKFLLKLTPFKHTGIFPEQYWEWQYISEITAASTQKPRILNLFAYTGVASIFAAKAGAVVTHVDASKPSITWANENRSLNKMDNYPIRWIVDDAIKFTEREIKRGNKYDAILMDPPVYGHGPTGLPWDFTRDFAKLLRNCSQLISNTPLFVIVNAYAVSTSATTLANTLQGYFNKFGGDIDFGELTLKEKSAGRLLSTGIWARWKV